MTPNALRNWRMKWVWSQPIESQPSLSRRELRLVSFRDHDRPMQFVGTYQNTDVFFKIAQQLAK